MKNLCKILMCVMLTALVSGLCGCSDTENEARSAFENTMNAFKSGDKNSIDEYYSFDRVTAYIDEADGEEFRDAVLSSLSSLEYTINSSKTVSSDAVVLNVNIETVDFSGIVDDFINDVIETVGSSEYQTGLMSMSDEEYNLLMTEKMKRCIENGSSNRNTETLDVTMIKGGSGKWIIGGNSEEVLGVLFENLSEAVDYLT